MAEEQHNAADPEAVAKQQEQVKAARLLELEDLRQILSTMAGVRFFRRMMAYGRVFSTTVTSADPHMTYFNEGARNLVNRYLADIAAVSPDKINLLLSTDNGEKKA